jgi:hypothetical protein
MIEVVADKKFYKDVMHESLRPTVPKDPRTHHASSSTPTAAPSRTTHSGGASSAPSVNSSFMKMFRGIFAMCWRTDQHMDNPLLEFPELAAFGIGPARCNQEIIHSQ